ncbi:dATP/dGTP diphosphohydrolase domain-containing protein [Brucella sp. TWI432]
MEGRKDDSEKVRMDLIPPEVIFALATVLTFGATKYAARNWEKGMTWGRVFGALMRHMWAWWGGKAPTTKSFLFGDLDTETNYSHLWHAICCLAFLITYEERGLGKDDRATQ